MEKEHVSFKKIKDFFSLQTFEILYIDRIKCFAYFAVKFIIGLNKLDIKILNVSYLFNNSYFSGKVNNGNPEI
ncbi:hypothetical protein B0E34_14860 [Chryseobacterium mucoviscidosis]|uniref:Uncharacterized protein n=1 Tax=Chryseobacterium mucoviscidosis TaxID=1945581 RepID=A0A202BVL4_9FLAO|nr:hypothetical protein B0E34_14860 [Chryseobacterium mucoviscidosis]